MAVRLYSAIYISNANLEVYTVSLWDGPVDTEGNVAMLRDQALEHSLVRLQTQEVRSEGDMPQIATILLCLATQQLPYQLNNVRLYMSLCVMCVESVCGVCGRGCTWYRSVSNILGQKTLPPAN